MAPRLSRLLGQSSGITQPSSEEDEEGCPAVPVIDRDDGRGKGEPSVLGPGLEDAEAENRVCGNRRFHLPKGVGPLHGARTVKATR